MAELIVIIGLCGSGKSSLCYKYNTHVIFDDFITHFYNGKLIDTIKEGNKVCIADPRLCIYKTFTRYIKQIELYTTNIELILFENNPTQCLINIGNRNDGRKGIENTIMKYSELYNLANYWDYKHKIISVWK